jgi:tetratricopeptide (TPR) repeat protein
MISLSDRREVWIWLVFVVLGFVIYSNTLEAPFYFDDLPNILQNPHIRLTQLTLEKVAGAAFKSHISSRPIANISFALNYYFHQYDIIGYHLTNIIIHTLAGILLYLLIKGTLSTPSLDSGDKRYGLVALFPALLWLVHPIQTQSVTYIVQRMNSMAAMFYVLSLLLYVHGRLAKENQSRWPWFSGCAIAGMLAMGCKQIAATLPFFILLYEWYFFRDLNRAWFKKFVGYSLGPFILLGILSFLYLGSNPWQALLSRSHHLDFTATERVLTQFRAVLHYMSLLIYPHPSRLNLDYDFTLSRSLIDPMTTLFSLVAILGLIGPAIYIARKERLISFSILWFFGNLVIESSVVNLEMVYEHRRYLPSTFFFLPIVFVVFRCIKKNWAVVGIMSTVIIVFCLWTYERNSVWLDPVALWRDSADKSEKKARPHLNLGVALAKQGRLDEAISHYLEALRREPDNEMAHISLGAALVKQGKLDEAVAHYTEALRIRPNYEVTHLSLGIVFTRQGKFNEAVAHYIEALKVKPTYTEAHKGLGVVLARQGQFDEAISHYRKALQLKPDDKLARMNLANALARQGKANHARVHNSDGAPRELGEAEEHNRLGIDLAQQGKLNEAMAHFSKALQIQPKYAETYYNMGVVLAGEGRLDEAVENYSEALRIKPDYAEAHNNPGIVLARQGRFEEAIAHFSEALRVRPDFEEAERNLRKAEGIGNKF